MEITVNAFHKTGLYPINRAVFRENDFRVHSNQPTSDRDVDTNRSAHDASSDAGPSNSPRILHWNMAHASSADPSNAPQILPVNISLSSNRGPSDAGHTLPMDIAHATASSVGHSNDHPSLLFDKTNSKGGNIASKSSDVRFAVSPKDITPLPSISAAQRSRRGGKASVITSSPYKSSLLKSVEVAMAAKNKKEVAAKCSRHIVGEKKNLCKCTKVTKLQKKISGQLKQRRI
ncbi:hypothetical protein PR048_015123 [Dryococelus australis]|uniref:Uncharacterized protein n=1 Tax=Dryococelus australis TaxID=614101 RepID=A0ABQ9HG85_9NEOP|nr:hypothetical protein PR048_015123 [Dryococelus australis]